MENTQAQQQTAGQAGSQQEKLFTQEEVNRIVGERLSRARRICRAGAGVKPKGAPAGCKGTPGRSGDTERALTARKLWKQGEHGKKHCPFRDLLQTGRECRAAFRGLPHNLDRYALRHGERVTKKRRS